MNTLAIVSGIGGTLVIFGIAAWMGPKIIRAIYPEEQHERMIKMHWVMVIVALVVLALAVLSVLIMPLIGQSSS